MNIAGKGYYNYLKELEVSLLFLLLLTNKQQGVLLSTTSKNTFGGTNLPAISEATNEITQNGLEIRLA